MAHEAEVQGLLEELTALGYTAKPPPQLGTAHAFDWVSDCLLWLAQRAAPDLSVPRDYSNEQRRVAFLSSLGSQLYAKTRVRLHLRRLYRGGGGAVRELRRLAGLLSSAASASSLSGLQRQAPSLADGERTQLRELSQRISASSAQLVAAITAAPAAAAGVAAAWAATADVGAVEQELTAGLAAAQKQAVQLEASVAGLGQEVQMLEARVEKRHVELDRLERRLDSLQAVKPAFSAEAEELEGELEGLYQQYLHRFRNLEWLEGALDAHAVRRQAEATEADKQLRRIQRQVAADEQRLLQGDLQNSSPNSLAASAELAGRLDSDDSEAELGTWGPKALPRLGGGGGAHAAAPGGGGKAAAAAAMDLHLLAVAAEEEGAGISGRSRLSLASGASGDVGAGGGGEAGGGSGKVTFAPSASSPTPGSPANGGTGPRPGSAARRATGSANALLRAKAGGGGSSVGGTAAPDVLTLDGPLKRRSSAADNDF
ncbi:hypothetical protein D9Q98_006809 [Chlorella vulgaris]|uniref:Clusterin-associated 1 n=1 Tax=Chlorella vulgaris TaxID=3077 RepID=A0A9D4TIV3_CHLVU|nr:hypothetical protein D9Q98_006809 [Chlorella vulgaris]